MQPQNNLVTEIILGLVAGLLVIGSVLLLYAGKIDLSGALAAWGIAAGIVGIKLALNAPSPSQQAQIGAQQSQVLSQQQQLQQLVSYALGMLPGLVQSLSQQQAPVVPPQPAQTAQPVQVQSPVPAPVVPPVASPGVMTSVVPPGANSVPGTPPAQTQFKTITIPDVSMPMAAVGQGIPLGQ